METRYKGFTINSVNNNKGFEMKKWIIFIAAIIAVFGVLYMISFSVENRAISYEEVIENTGGDIRVEEKRRYDLIPNLVECVKQYDLHEYNTLKDVIAARGGNSNGDGKAVDEIKAAINVVVEKYPELKSQKNYQDLMNELSITENKISQMRKHYNKNLTDYKRFVRQFPSKQFLSLRGYEVKDYERLSFETSSVDAPKNIFGNSENK